MRSNPGWKRHALEAIAGGIGSALVIAALVLLVGMCSEAKASGTNHRLEEVDWIRTSTQERDDTSIIFEAVPQHLYGVNEFGQVVRWGVGVESEPSGPFPGVGPHKSTVLLPPSWDGCVTITARLRTPLLDLDDDGEPEGVLLSMPSGPVNRGVCLDPPPAPLFADEPPAPLLFVTGLTLLPLLRRKNPCRERGPARMTD